MNDEPKCTWVQVLRQYNKGGDLVRLTNIKIGSEASVVWKYPKRVHHLHVGTYGSRKQFTVIAESTEYRRERYDDMLGERIASGTPDEMYKMMYDYGELL